MRYFSMFSGIGGFEHGIERAFDDRRVQQENTGTCPVPVQSMPQQCSCIGTDQEQSTDKESLPSEGDNVLSTIETREHGSKHTICVGYSEIDKYAIRVYEKHYGGTKNYGDCTKINYSEVPDFDMLVGGSPCQDLSIAGKGKGLSGERSGLFFQYVRCLKEKKPMYFIWENVKGALSSSLGWDFARVQIEFSEAGYDCQWLVFNSKDFGVPQNRERIFIVGTRTGSFREVLPFRRGDEKTTGDYAYAIDANYSKGCADVMKKNRTVLLHQLNDVKHSTNRIYSDDSLARNLRASAGGYGAKTGLYAIPARNVNKTNVETDRAEGRRFKDEDDEMFTLTGQDIHGIAINVQKVGTLYNGQNGEVFSTEGISPTIRSGVTDNPDNGGICSYNSPKIIVHNLQPRSTGRPSLQKNPSAGGHGHLTKQDDSTYCLDANCTQAGQLAYRIRRLTPKECERLQAFPDDYTLYDKEGNIVSDTQRYKMMGNAVTTSVVQAIIKGMLNVGCF